MSLLCTQCCVELGCHLLGVIPIWAISSSCKTFLLILRLAEMGLVLCACSESCCAGTPGVGAQSLDLLLSSHAKMTRLLIRSRALTLSLLQDDIVARPARLSFFVPLFFSFFLFGALRALFFRAFRRRRRRQQQKKEWLEGPHPLVSASSSPIHLLNSLVFSILFGPLFGLESLMVASLFFFKQYPNVRKNI